MNVYFGGSSFISMIKADSVHATAIFPPYKETSKCYQIEALCQHGLGGLLSQVSNFVLDLQKQLFIYKANTYQCKLMKR